MYYLFNEQFSRMIGVRKSLHFPVFWKNGVAASSFASLTRLVESHAKQKMIGFFEKYIIEIEIAVRKSIFFRSLEK